MTQVRISYENGDVRTIGDLQGDTLYCKRDPHKHLFRSGMDTVSEARAAGVSAWGLDCKVCDGLIERGAQWLVVVVGSEKFRAPLTALQGGGFVLHMKPHRPQYFLYEDQFEKVDGDER